MKFKSCETLAKMVSRKIGSRISRVSKDGAIVWFNNNWAINYDGEFIVVSDYSGKTRKTVMACYSDSYRTQKDFFNDLDVYLNQYDEICHEKELAEQPTEELKAEPKKPTHIDTDTVQPTGEVANNSLSEKYGKKKKDYCITNWYPDLPHVDLYKVRAAKYKNEVKAYCTYYNNPTNYAKPRWAQKPKLQKVPIGKLYVHKAFYQMVRDAYRYKNTIERLLSVHSYLMKLYQKNRISIDEYRFYTNKLENMYNNCLR